jgi:hypothetical protein
LSESKLLLWEISWLFYYFIIKAVTILKIRLHLKEQEAAFLGITLSGTCVIIKRKPSLKRTKGGISWNHFGLVLHAALLKENLL